MNSALQQRALGAYLGFATGDALGATVEFMTAAEIRAAHGVHREIVGGGWLHLKRGQVTDDTQMCLALGEALLAGGGWEVRSAADALVRWMRGRPPDIGHTCRRGIRRYMLDGSLMAPPTEDHAGNGGVMRCLPLALATVGHPAGFRRSVLEQVHLTHNHPLSDAATLLLGGLTQILLQGASLGDCRRALTPLLAAHPVFRFEPWPGNTSGFVVDTVQTVLYAFFRTDSVESCVVEAVNRGGDADTIGALAGQLAGAAYGVESVPERWLKRLDPVVTAAIRRQTEGLLALARDCRQAD